MPGKVRIIAGYLKGRRLPVLDQPAIRPTPDRVRETLFNWLHDRVEGSRCLDLFAGSGALGIEACSRGAREILLVERDARAARALDAQVRRIDAVGASVVHADVLRWIAAPPRGVYDLVFVDPPYGTYPPVEVLARLERGGWLAPSARVYLETDAAHPLDPLPAGWSMLRSGKAGQVRYHLATRE